MSDKKSVYIFLMAGVSSNILEGGTIPSGCEPQIKHPVF